MIGIVNVSPQATESGPHEYEVRINFQPIFRFVHNREEPLSVLLHKASVAALGREKDIAVRQRRGKR